MAVVNQFYSIPSITRPKNNILASFFLELGCPKHYLHAHIYILWVGHVWCTSEIGARYSSIVCHALRDFSTTRPNRPFFQLQEKGKVLMDNHNDWLEDLVLFFVAFEG